ncbi:A.superbus venom factor 2-like [Gouania willdenowi]|uniref:A.superbus venom factor 2-like n=1 Tax=Gouania willdenowi TaxID=441366 RepID=UPI001056A241|nr:A.superbus venom factor 2-like [Gouania willdenowi]
MIQWRLHSIFFLMLLCHSKAQFNMRRFVLLAPDLLRTDNPENIYVQAEGLSAPITVSISIQDFTRSTTLLQESVILNTENQYYALKSIQLPSDGLARDEKNNKFVNLKVEFEDLYSEESLLMVSFHSGYIFLSTDKPIYNPGDTVRFRAFVSSLNFKALDASITIDIQNPDGVVVKEISRTRATDGVSTDTFVLSEVANEGLWVLTARFDHWQQNTFTSQFEVKKYVLPAFNVTLTPKATFLSLDDKEFAVEVSARYLYGKPVQGTAFVVFGVKMNKEMIRLPSVKKTSELNGGVVKLSMDELKMAYPNIRSLVGNSLYVRASVLTKTGSDLVEAEKSGIKIVESPYVLLLKDMPKYFKPGLHLDFTIQVNHHDGSPASNVPVNVKFLKKPEIVYSGKIRVSILMPKALQAQTITAETAQAGLRPEQQAKHQVTVQPYETFDQNNQNYLYISTGSNMVSKGDRVSFKLIISCKEKTHRSLIKHITYLVISKGKIITAKRLDVSSEDTFTFVALMVTPDMMPSFRFVAFYSIHWIGREEVVSDSVWIDVVDSCIGELKVGPVDGEVADYKPGKSFSFQIRGEPGSKVSLVAVDNAVYLLNKEKLTQKKIWNTVEHGDIGCTHGGGRDALAVFTDAGLFYSSNGGLKTVNRNVMQCPGTSRSRRSAERLQQKAQLENHYKEELQRRCCRDGLKTIPMPYSCTRRSLYITEGAECILAFRYCCAHYRGQVYDTRIPTTLPPMTTPIPTITAVPTFSSHHIPHIHRVDRVQVSPRSRSPSFSLGHFEPLIAYSHVNMEKEPLVAMRSMVLEEEEVKLEVEEEEEEEEEWEYMDRKEVYLRSKFFESWLWIHVTLPNKVDIDGLATKEMRNALPDSITEWGIMAVSTSSNTGFCVAEPFNVKVWKNLFVDLKLPYSVARNERVEIKAVIHNYGDNDMHVNVVLMKTEGICSVAFKDTHTQEVLVAARSSVAVPYTIVPVVVGKLHLEVMVVGRGRMGGDRIEKSLRVVLDGVQKTHVWSMMLNPSSEGGIQRVRASKPELKSVVPHSVPEAFINIRGNVLADSIENSISEDSLGTLIRMPGGCVEQNLASITLPLIATLYLDKTKGWEKVGVQRREEALRYIRTGYERQLAYRRPDGSYPPYKHQGASTWITAYVVKVFSMANSFIGIKQKEVCDPILYLIKHKISGPDTMFREDNPVYSPTMMGGLVGDDPQTTLTAFVLIALGEAQQAGIDCGVPDSHRIKRVIQTIADKLKKALQKPGRRPYTVAIVSYALAIAAPKSINPTQLLLRAAAPGGTHWPDHENHLFTLEATGYALLTLVKYGRMEEAAAPFKWLNSQRRRGGGFGSTQPTMVVFQALSEYIIKKPQPKDLGLKVDVRLTGRKEIRYVFNSTTNYAARTSRLPADLDLEVEARGNGQGIIEIVTYYNQLHEVDENQLCTDFELNVAIEESIEKIPEDVEKSYQLTIKVRALGPSDVRMVVLDISLPTGFTPENSDLEMLSNSVDQYINYFKIVDNLSDRGSLILHLFKVSHKESEILFFRLQQRFKVGLLQPSSVTVYEYYNPDQRCSRTYSPPENKQDLSMICRDDINICRCTQNDCCIFKTDSENFPNKEREAFACKTLHHVFQVKVVNISRSYYDKYEMEITQVIKLGVEDSVTVGQKRTFMSNGGCRDGLNLELGVQYLIIGPTEDKWDINTNTNRIDYVLGKNTWVERWPSPAECSSNTELGKKCKSLNDAVAELSNRGCGL